MGAESSKIIENPKESVEASMPGYIKPEYQVTS